MKQSFPVIQKGKPNKLSLIKVEQPRRERRLKTPPDPQHPNMGGYLLAILSLLIIGALIFALFN